MTPSKLRESKHNMFSENETVEGAYEYAMDVLKSEGASGAVAVTALMVYHNTLIEAIAQELED
jgi:hypothetical protein